MDGQAQFAIAAEGREPASIEAASAALWAGLTLGDDARSALRRDGLDPARLRLSGPHPFAFEQGPDGTIRVSARAGDAAAAEQLLDLFRVYFLSRLASA